MRAPGCGRYKAPGCDKTQESYGSIKTPGRSEKTRPGARYIRKTTGSAVGFPVAVAGVFCGRIPARRQKETDEKSMTAKPEEKNARFSGYSERADGQPDAQFDLSVRALAFCPGFRAAGAEERNSGSRNDRVSQFPVRSACPGACVLPGFPAIQSEPAVSRMSRFVSSG